MVLVLLPFPHFGNCAACGIYFVFESAATGLISVTETPSVNLIGAGYQ